MNIESLILILVLVIFILPTVIPFPVKSSILNTKLKTKKYYFRKKNLS